jgi:hypothetical protein
VIADPDYARAFTKMRCTAWSHGYALMVHGTATRDLDVLAVPWVEKPSEPDRLFADVQSALKGDWQDSKHVPKAKPHGRRVWTLIATKFGDPRFIDFGVIEPAGERP